MIADAAERGWWYRERTRLVTAALDRHDVVGPVWDVGAGTGVVTPRLRRGSDAAIAIEPSREGCRMARKRGVTAICGTLPELHLPSGCLRSITMLDVIEHIADPIGPLREAARVLIPGGTLVVTVPAHAALWSHDDVEAGHHRRYGRRTLARDLTAAGFEVVECRYFFAITAVAVLVARVLPYRVGLSRPLIATGDAVAAGGGPLGRIVALVERGLVGRVPFGSSLLAVARTPG
jgi:SAM-dependent methyltransferase